MIAIRDLRVDYDNLCAVHDLSLEVDEGEVCGLIGPNGAGKTTTMRTMLGLIEPTYGEIEIMGIDVHEQPHEVAGWSGSCPISRRSTRTCSSGSSSTCSRPATGFRPRSRPELVDRYLEHGRPEEKRDAPVVELSRGMRQRLMLAKTLIPDPQVLLLDEPASGVDPQGRIDLKNILKRLAAEGKTILISSHILAEMNEFCTSVAIMERGRLVVSGRIDEVNARIMGDSSLSVEVLGETEAFLRILAEDGRAGPAERKGNAFEFRFRGGAEEASELLARLVGAGRPGRLVRPAEREPGGAVPQGGRQGAFMMRSDWLADWFDNPIFVKHVRSRLRRQPLVVGHRRHRGALPLHRLGRVITRSLHDGWAFGTLFALQAVILAIMGARRWARRWRRRGPRESSISTASRRFRHRARARLLLRAPVREYLLFACTLPFVLLCLALGTPDFRGLVQLMIVLISTSWVLQGFSLLERPGHEEAGRLARGGRPGDLPGPDERHLHHRGLAMWPTSSNSEPEAEPLRRLAALAGCRPALRDSDAVLPFPRVAPEDGIGTAASVFQTAGGRGHGDARVLLAGGVWDLTGLRGHRGPVLYLLVIIGILLTLTVTPTQAEYYKGLWRAVKQGRPRLSFWDDLSPNRPFLAVVCALVLVTGDNRLETARRSPGE